MSGPNWNDLQFLLAISRRGSIAGAARLLNVDTTTVSRRLSRLERTMGNRLVRREQGGRQELTQAGEQAVRLADAVQSDLNRMTDKPPETDRGASGVVRLTSVPIVINRLLTPALRPLLSLNPGLQLELIADARDQNLTRREADMAIRLGRPRFGGTKVKARRIGDLRYYTYRSAELADDAAPCWIGYDDTTAHLPQARWIDEEILRSAQTAAVVRVNDNETAYQAVLAGLGISLLPALIADQDKRLARLNLVDGQPLVSREIWLLVHAELIGFTRIRAVSDRILRSLVSPK